MILWAFKPHKVETIPAWNTAPLRAWRWVVDVGPMYVSAQEQVRFGEADWHSSHSLSHLHIGLSRRVSSWHVGMHHDYYDGPQHALWIGPLYFNWAFGWCDICMPPEEEDTSGAVAGFVEALLVGAMTG